MLVPACASVAVPTPYRVAEQAQTLAGVDFDARSAWCAALQVQGQPVRGYRRAAGVCPTMDLEPPARRSQAGSPTEELPSERYVLAFRSKSMSWATSSGLANMMVRSSSWIMRP